MQGDPTDLNVFESLLDMAEGIKGQEQFRDFSKAIQNLLDESDCGFLDYSDGQFQCLELVDRLKKKRPLGLLPEEAKKMCMACERGKLNRENKQIRKLLRGRTIKTFKQIAKFMADIVKSGLPGTITFCNRLDPPTGTGMPTIFCSKHDQSVDINKVCKDPICKFLEQYNIKIHSEYAEKALAQIEQIASEYEQLEGPPIKKDVDVEQVDLDVEPQ